MLPVVVRGLSSDISAHRLNLIFPLGNPRHRNPLTAEHERVYTLHLAFCLSISLSPLGSKRLFPLGSAGPLDPADKQVRRYLWLAQVPLDANQSLRTSVLDLRRAVTGNMARPRSVYYLRRGGANAK